MGKRKYIDDECEQCDEWYEMFSCMNHECPIYRDYIIGRAEIAADDEHDRRKDNRMEEEKENE